MQKITCEIIVGSYPASRSLDQAWIGRCPEDPDFSMLIDGRQTWLCKRHSWGAAHRWGKDTEDRRQSEEARADAIRFFAKRHQEE